MSLVNVTIDTIPLAPKQRCFADTSDMDMMDPYRASFYDIPALMKGNRPARGAFIRVFQCRFAARRQSPVTPGGIFQGQAMNGK